MKNTKEINGEKKLDDLKKASKDKMDLAKKKVVEYTVTKGCYKTNDELIADFFALLDIAPTPRGERYISSEEDIRRYPKLHKEIMAKVKRSAAHTSSVPIINMMREYRLSLTSLEIIIYVFYQEIRDTFSVNLVKVAEYLSGGRKKLLLSKMKLLNKNSPLFKSGLLTIEKRFPSHNMFNSEIKLTPKSLEYFMGSKKSVSHKKEKTNQKFKSPREIYEKLSEYIMGQEASLKKISVAVYNHLQRISLPSEIKKNIKKSNVLMLGPTGCGKTYICEILARILDVPFVSCDATRYTESGYVGGNVDDMLDLLLDKAGGDKKAAEKGIIYIDEIDKLASRRNTVNGRDVSGISVQQELLRLLEGDSVDAYVYKGFRQTAVKYNISDVLFICGGAFVGIDEIIKRRLKSSHRFGFQSEQSDSVSNDLNKLRISDIEEYGMIPELIGRLPVIAVLSPLDREALVRILTTSRESIFGQYNSLFKNSGIRIEMDSDLANIIADEALKRGYGARGLRQIVEEMLSPMLFENIESPDVTKRLIINAEKIKQR